MSRKKIPSSYGDPGGPMIVLTHSYLVEGWKDSEVLKEMNKRSLTHANGRY